MSEQTFFGEDPTLFARKWDRSQWYLRVDILRRDDSLCIPVYGYCGEHRNLITLEGFGQVSCADYESRFEHACTTLRDQLQMQLDDSI